MEYIESNITVYDSETFAKAESIAAIIVPLFFSIIAITGFFGNSLVILVVFANPQMHSTTNLLIVNLACADLLFVIFCIPFTASDYIFYKWPFSLAWCKIVQYLIVVTTLASVYTLVLMSLDRFLAVVYPISSRTIRTERITKISIRFMWLFIVIISLPILFLHGLRRSIVNQNEYLSCTFAVNNYISQKVYFIIFILTIYFVPLFIIVGLYFRIILRLSRSVTGNTLSAESKRGRKRVTRLVCIIILAFATLWFPIQIIMVLKSFDVYPENVFSILMQIISHIFAYTSSCINPLLYAFLSENFRKAFQKAINFPSKYRPYEQTNIQKGETSDDIRRISAIRTSTTVI